ncbi:MAG: DedA family protein [Alloprevotella sp.]|nr:DedA family protein [Alloprevotella sp.]
MFQSLTDLLIAHGTAGMFIAAFLAGSFFPFASEVVMLGLLAVGTDATGLLLWGTAGNTLGGLFNYGIGRMGNPAWIERYAKVPPEKLEQGLARVRRYGSWAGLLAWVPFLGSVLTVSMGYLRCRLPYCLFNIAVGKFARYALLISAYKAI